MKVEFQLRWFLLLASIVILFILRNSRTLLIVYTTTVVIGTLVYLLVLPRLAANAERTFNRESLRLLAMGDLPALDRLVRRQWLIKHFGRRHVIPDARGLAASAANEPALACRFYAEALRYAPPEERPRIELNLAHAEMSSDKLDAAEGRYRAVLVRRPTFGPALANLARVLLRQGDTTGEAAHLLESAVEHCDPRELAELQLLRAEALLKAGKSGWRHAIEAAQAAGADPEAVAHIQEQG